MADFKIEDNIPIPVEDYEDPSDELDRPVISTDDPEDDEDPEVPGKRGRKPRCKMNDLHVWEELNSQERRCKLCGDIFPCRNEAKCFHVDCWEARGKIHPWIVSGTMAPKTHSEPYKGKCLYCQAPEGDTNSCRGIYGEQSEICEASSRPGEVESTQEVS